MQIMERERFQEKRIDVELLSYLRDVRLNCSRHEDDAHIRPKGPDNLCGTDVVKQFQARAVGHPNIAEQANRIWRSAAVATRTLPRL